MSIIFLLLMIIPLILLLLVIAMVFMGVGLRNFIQLFKIKLLVKKGYGYIKIYYPTGYPRYTLFNFKEVEDGLIEPFGKGKGQYIFKKRCMYQNEYNIPTIDYMKGESDPLDGRTGLISTTNPKVLENLIAGAVRARTAGDINPLLDLIKKYWWVPAILIGAFLVMIYFMYDGQSQALNQCMSMGKTVVINSSSLGK